MRRPLRSLPRLAGLALLAAATPPAMAQPAPTVCPESVPATPPLPAWPRVFFMTSRFADCSARVPRLAARRATGPSYGQADGSRRPMRFQLDSRTDWEEALEQRLAAAPGRRAMIFVHGFNNSSSTPLERGRALAIATGFDGPVIVLLWPSKGSGLAYAPDEATAEWTTAYFRWLLAFVAGRADRLTIVSHSMGNRITLDPVRDLARERPALAAKIDHFVIASADVDRGALARDLGQDFGRLRARLTIYASSEDWPLWYSTQRHQHARGGYLGRQLTAAHFPVRAENAILVDTSDAAHTIDAHADFILSRQGAADLCRLLRDEEVAPGRAAVPTMERTVRLVARPPDDACAQRAAAAIRWLSK